MQQFSNYPNSTPQKSTRQSKALVGAMMFFMLLGFLAGVGILLVRNTYLFS